MSTIRVCDERYKHGRLKPPIRHTSILELNNGNNSNGRNHKVTQTLCNSNEYALNLHPANFSTLVVKVYQPPTSRNPGRRKFARHYYDIYVSRTSTLHMTSKIHMEYIAILLIIDLIHNQKYPYSYSVLFSELKSRLTLELPHSKLLSEYFKYLDGLDRITLPTYLTLVTPVPIVGTKQMSVRSHYLNHDEFGYIRPTISGRSSKHAFQPESNALKQVPMFMDYIHVYSGYMLGAAISASFDADLRLMWKARTGGASTLKVPRRISRIVPWYFSIRGRAKLIACQKARPFEHRYVHSVRTNVRMQCVMIGMMCINPFCGTHNLTLD